VKSKDEAGNEAVSGDYTFTTSVIPNEPPNQPSNISPANEATGVSLAPTLKSSTFADPDASDTHASSQWQATNTAGDYSSPEYDSGNSSANLTSMKIPPDILSIDTTYHWHVRYQDNHGSSSEYSAETSFMTRDLVVFPDPNLEAIIRELIGKPTGAILQSDLLGITTLSADSLYIADLTGLEYCANLTWLSLLRNQISDITPLSSLSSLTHLELSSNDISDITPLSDFTTITDLFLESNQIGDITALSNLTSLTQLWIGYNQISDISPLRNLTSLTYLGLQDNQIGDITVLGNLTSLGVLWLDDNQIGDITVLGNLTSLQRLYLHSNQISDISPLANLTWLEELGLYNNQISDISPLENLTRLEWLQLRGNQISNIEPLVQNQGLSEGDMIHLRDNPLSYESINTYIPQLEARGISVLHDAP
jgi:hypothetical protein